MNFTKTWPRSINLVTENHSISIGYLIGIVGVRQGRFVLQWKLKQQLRIICFLLKISQFLPRKKLFRPQF